MRSRPGPYQGSQGERGGARLQLPGQPLVRRRLRADDRGQRPGDRERRLVWPPRQRRLLTIARPAPHYKKIISAPRPADLCQRVLSPANGEGPSMLRRMLAVGFLVMLSAAANA